MKKAYVNLIFHIHVLVDEQKTIIWFDLNLNKYHEHWKCTQIY
jgi:hypothetical protein